MKKYTMLLLALLFLAGGTVAAAENTACKMRCDTARLTCNQHDAHSLNCGRNYSNCTDECDPSKKLHTSPIASCQQHCEDSALQCGIANGNNTSCRDGRDACLARCDK